MMKNSRWDAAFMPRGSEAGCGRFRSGYGQCDEAVSQTIRDMMAHHGIPLDGTYTGKAWHGMRVLAREEQWKNRRVLFLHTGGTPLFFDGRG